MIKKERRKKREKERRRERRSRIAPHGYHKHRWAA